MTILYDFEKRKDFDHHDNKKLGQYVYEPEEKQRRPIIMINEDGTEKYFDSVYQAAKAIELNKNSCGNISKACDGNKAAYGKRWKWVGINIGSHGEVGSTSTK